MLENEAEMRKMRACLAHKKGSRPGPVFLLQVVDVLPQAACAEGMTRKSYFYQSKTFIKVLTNIC